MNDEIRRLIYELVVEAKGVKEAEQKVSLAGQAMEKMTAQAKRMGGALAAAFAVKEIAQTLGDIQKMQSQLKTLGLSSAEAAKGIQQIEDIAVTTGSTIAEVADVYAAAIQATQKLGGTQKDAAELANAFTRAAKAQGKSAAEAAGQLDTLQFAMDRGTVKAKELTAIIKSNTIFQQAAEKAMGKTTAEIIKMAEAGKIASTDLAKMLSVMKTMGADTAVPTTLEGITNSLIGAAKAFIDATAGAAGLNDSLSKGTTGWQKFLDILRLIGETIGAVISLAFNLVETMVQGAIAINVAFIQAIQGNFSGAAETFDIYAQEVKANVDEVAAAMKRLKDAALTVVGQGPIAEPGRQLGDADALAEQERQAAREASFDKGADLFIKGMLEEAEKAQKIREDQARDDLAAARDRYKKESDEYEAAQKERLELQRYYDDLRKKAGEDAVEAAQDTNTESFRQLRKQFEEAEELALAGAQVIGDALSNVFSGASHNARDFFRNILQGFAQMAQQALIQKLIKSMAGSGGFGAFMSGIMGAEHGRAFDRGTVVPFAQGGVVGGPTGFAMTGGRMGLMGEAGAEAIMPLRRGKDGKFGVTGARPRVEIHNNLGVAADASVEDSGDRMRIILEAAQLGADMAEGRVNRSLRTGYGSTAQSVQRTYGLRRRF